MRPEALRVDMSADSRERMGIQHMTVVPENFEPTVDPESDDESEDAA